MSVATTIIRQTGEGERMWFAGGGLFVMKATAAETGGAYMLFEDYVEKGKVTPLHLHPNEDEAIFVLEGEILVHFDGNNHVVGEGGFFAVPRGVPHAFMATSESRLLCLQTPGSGEEFYRSVSDPAEGASPDEMRKADFARLRAAAERSPSIVLLGPPPFAPLEAAEVSG